MLAPHWRWIKGELVLKIIHAHKHGHYRKSNSLTPDTKPQLYFATPSLQASAACGLCLPTSNGALRKFPRGSSTDSPSYSFETGQNTWDTPGNTFPQACLTGTATGTSGPLAHRYLSSSCVRFHFGSPSGPEHVQTTTEPSFLGLPARHFWRPDFSGRVPCLPSIDGIALDRLHFPARLH